MKANTLFVLLIFAFGCNHQPRQVTNQSEIEQLLSKNSFARNDAFIEEMRFWNDRLARNGNDEAALFKMAGLHAQTFKTTGRIEDIWTSDSLYKKVLEFDPHGNVDAYHGLAINAISQHQFQDARMYAEKALSLVDKKAISLLLLIDASIETGDYATANRTLQQFKNTSSFAYLIRKARYKDLGGQLDSAIFCMEKAYKRIKGNPALAQWTLTNLGDMYGHAGMVKRSYDAYIKVLRNDPGNDHALKGIAWIALAHDKKPETARWILNALTTRQPMPDIELTLAEIAEVDGNQSLKRKHLEKFKALVSRPGYKQMYQRHLAFVEAEEFDPTTAVTLALHEIKSRPTPESYDLLAWAYYHAGDVEKALEVSRSKVQDQTSEPQTFYHTGMIYLANGDKKHAKYFLSKALESKFELGPAKTSKIRMAVQSM
jgi:tetratricopeptide (TPR) repeat protein